VGIEIERKFLVVSDDWRAGADPVRIRQGYLSADGERTVRVRVKGDAGFITVKGKPHGPARAEFEYAIPLADANAMLDRLCLRPLIEKVRHIVWHAGLRWEVDEFLNENAPLVVAEIELWDAAQAVPLPAWAGEEVTGDPRYTNSNLARKPFSRW
jgi:CYTH domain-containing protein